MSKYVIFTESQPVLFEDIIIQDPELSKIKLI